MLECVITSSVLILALSALRRVLRGRINPRLMYGLWLLAALRLLLPFSLFESPVSVLGFAGTHRRRRSGPAGTRRRPDKSPRSAPAKGTSSPLRGAAPQVADPLRRAAVRRRRTVPGRSCCAGVAGGPVWSFGSCWSTCACADPPPGPAGGGPLPASVYVSGTALPCLAGLLRPAIYLTPPAWSTRPAAPCAGPRDDPLPAGRPLWAWVRCLCLAFYWFDPLVWLAAALSRRDCELSCDAGAIARLGNRSASPTAARCWTLWPGPARGSSSRPPPLWPPGPAPCGSASPSLPKSPACWPSPWPWWFWLCWPSWPPPLPAPPRTAARWRSGSRTRQERFRRSFWSIISRRTPCWRLL